MTSYTKGWRLCLKVREPVKATIGFIIDYAKVAQL